MVLVVDKNKQAEIEAWTEDQGKMSIGNGYM